MPVTRPCTHWTADTELAFDMALRLYGRPKQAAAAIGRTVAAAYLRRQRCPAFAARWEAALDEWRRHHATADAPPAFEADDLPMVERFDGFTQQRRRAFLHKLTETGDVEEACRYIRMTPKAAYGVRRAHPSFRAAWDRALDLSIATIERAMIERAVHGIEEDVWYAGKRVGRRRRYSDGLLRDLAKRGTPAAPTPRTKRELMATAEQAAERAGGSFSPRRATREETDAALRRKLEALARRTTREERRKAAAVAVRLLAEGKVP